MGTVNSLRFDRRVPPGIEQKDVFCCRQVQAQPTGLQADQKQLAVFVRLKSLDSRLAVAGSPIQVFISDAVFIQTVADDGEQTRELRKDQHLMAFRENFCQLVEQQIEFGARVFGAFLIDQAGVAGRLA